MTSPSKPSLSPVTGLLLKSAALLWVVWGLVHVLAGVLTIRGDTATAAQGIADAVDPALFKMPYPDAVGAIINQHGFNLLWVGAVTTACAPFIWCRSLNAVFLAALVAGLTDLGYFLFLDRGGYVHFVPGTVMTLICASAILLSLAACLRPPTVPALDADEG